MGGGSGRQGADKQGCEIQYLLNWVSWQHFSLIRPLEGRWIYFELKWWSQSKLWHFWVWPFAHFINAIWNSWKLSRAKSLKSVTHFMWPMQLQRRKMKLQAVDSRLDWFSWKMTKFQLDLKLLTRPFGRWTICWLVPQCIAMITSLSCKTVAPPMAKQFYKVAPMFCNQSCTVRWNSSSTIGLLRNY